MIDLQILGTVPRPGKWNWSFGIWFYRKLSGSPRDEKIKHFAKYKCWNFFKLAHFFSHFSQCNPISNIHPKHTDHCFQFFSNQTWSITNITRMPLLISWLLVNTFDVSCKITSYREFQRTKVAFVCLQVNVHRIFVFCQRSLVFVFFVCAFRV